MSAPRMRPAVLLPARGAASLDPAFPIDDLARLQQVVGGDIQLVRLSPVAVDQVARSFGITFAVAQDVRMVLHEEGKLLGLPYNLAASQLYPGDAIVGDVLIVEMPPDEPDEGDE